MAMITMMLHCCTFNRCVYITMDGHNTNPVLINMDNNDVALRMSLIGTCLSYWIEYNSKLPP